MSDITAIRGDNETYDLTIADALGNRVDLTSASLWFTVKARKADRDNAMLIRKTVGSGITLADQGSPTTKGMSTIAILPNDTAKLLAPNDYYYDVQLKVGDTITTVVDGVFALEEDITAATS